MRFRSKNGMQSDKLLRYASQLAVYGGVIGSIDISYVKAYVVRIGDKTMTTLNATEARSKLYNLIDETAQTHQPIVITGKRGNAVLLAEEDWNSINETLFLLSVPGMRESIREGMATELEECDKDLDW